MQVIYKNKRIERICTSATVAEKRYGLIMAQKIHHRIDELHIAKSVEEMIHLGIGRCHSLKGTRKNQYAVDLVHPFRLVFEKHGNEIHIVKVLEVVDYH